MHCDGLWMQVKLSSVELLTMNLRLTVPGFAGQSGKDGGNPYGNSMSLSTRKLAAPGIN